jgi:HPr kinase/phosphorylase
VVRGHRLVADDTVEIRRRADTVLLGSCPELTRHHMEIRGLGVINIRDLFGVASTRSSKRVELVVQLERWETGREYDRLGLDEERFEILGVPVPMIRMPVAPGRNVAILVEVAARNQLLRARGHHAARALAERLDRALLNDARSAIGEPARLGAAAAAGRLESAEDEADRGDEDDA